VAQLEAALRELRGAHESSGREWDRQRAQWDSDREGLRERLAAAMRQVEEGRGKLEAAGGREREAARRGEAAERALQEAEAARQNLAGALKKALSQLDEMEERRAKGGVEGEGGVPGGIASLRAELEEKEAQWLVELQRRDAEMASLRSSAQEKEAQWEAQEHLRDAEISTLRATMQVRAMVFINPGNPTGQCLTRQDLEGLDDHDEDGDDDADPYHNDDDDHGDDDDDDAAGEGGAVAGGPSA
jgi:DNA repair exonuclease SbcCD ATPase subunit